MSTIRVWLSCGVLAACSIPAKQAGHTGDASDGDGSAGSSDGSATPIDAMVDAVPGAPMVVLTGMPDPDGNQTTATFTYTCSDATASLECRLDAQPYAACPLPSKTFTGVPDGAHAFDLRATADGKTGVIPTYAFTVDTVAPALVFTAQPAADTNSATAQFMFTTGDAATVTCQLDAQAAAACTSPQAYPGLADGSHTFTLQGVDTAGNIATKTASWIIDTVPPTLSIVMEPASVSIVATAQFTFTDGGATSVTCQLDAGTAAACTSPHGYSSLADGSHTFTLTAKDDAGNATTKTYTWTIDTTPPALSITAYPPSLANSQTAPFMFTTGDAVTVTCQLDAGTPAACTSPQTYMGVADGSHVFTLRGTDSAGNTATKTYSWTIDTTPPDVSIVASSEPPSPTKVTSATFQFNTGDATTVTCQLDGIGPAPCASTKAYSGIADGSHTFTVVGTDAAGNTAQAMYTWTVDTQAPTVTITSAPTGPIATKSASIGFSVSDGVTTCSLDGGSPVACSSPYAVVVTGDGVHTVAVSATDAASNVGSASTMWLVDTTPPVVSLGAVDYSGCPSTFSISWTRNDPGTGINKCTCSYPFTGTYDCTAATSLTSTIPASGFDTFSISCTDNLGNTSPLKTAKVNELACP
ncbi:MAG TPA: Ig-like domain-containing protein [Kofleriaceae bacterium]|jgi:hypothetical protein